MVLGTPFTALGIFQAYDSELELLAETLIFCTGPATPHSVVFVTSETIPSPG